MNIFSCSGGKDSVASIVLALENNIPIDLVLICEVMFSHSENISGEHPLHYNFIYNVLIPFLTANNVPYIVVKDKDDYLSLFNKRIYRSSVLSRIGKKRGFFLSGKCLGNSVLKMRPIKQFYGNLIEPFNVCLGIAFDESIRLKRFKNNQFSLLERFKIVESETFNLLKPYNLLSPIYDIGYRNGCWFCPNATIKQFAYLEKNFPNLYYKLIELGNDNDLVRTGFKYSMTIFDLHRQVINYNNQISIFDLIRTD